MVSPHVTALGTAIFYNARKKKTLFSSEMTVHIFLKSTKLIKAQSSLNITSIYVRGKDEHPYLLAACLKYAACI